MINPHSLTLPWIEDVSKQLRIRDKVLLEKTIRALHLLEGLVVQGLDFVFKGGTALMLHLGSRNRLSIDIDVIIPNPPDDLFGQLQMVAERGGFVRVEENTREQRSGLRKAHYKFWFKPSYKTSRDEEYVLLDIIFEPIRYLDVRRYPILSPLLSQEGEVLEVLMPSLEDLLGDKLTAFAPSTTGIPYFKHGDPKAMEIVKQLFDIGSMFELVTDLSRTRQTFQSFAQSELAYRGLEVAGSDLVLQDIVETAYCLSMRGSHLPENFAELQMGIQRVQSFIFSESYHLDKAITHAAKAAYLARAIAIEMNTLNRFDHASAPETPLIADAERNKLNKLKKSNHEAFYYWQQALAL